MSADAAWPLRKSLLLSAGMALTLAPGCGG
jgi:hypothetical protein